MSKLFPWSLSIPNCIQVKWLTCAKSSLQWSTQSWRRTWSPMGLRRKRKRKMKMKMGKNEHDWTCALTNAYNTSHSHVSLERFPERWAFIFTCSTTLDWTKPLFYCMVWELVSEMKYHFSHYNLNLRTFCLFRLLFVSLSQVSGKYFNMQVVCVVQALCCLFTSL